MEPSEIFELIIKADERLKYATDAQAGTRREQARGFLIQARGEADAIGNQALVDQAERRLADLDTLAGGGPGAQGIEGAEGTEGAEGAPDA